MPSLPKRHHYLPESYLRRFTCEGKPASEFWVYDIERAEFRPQTPHGTGVQTHYYSITLSDGTRDSRLETAFSGIEGSAVGLIGKVENRRELTNAERSELAYFLALLKVRGPQFEGDCNKSGEHLTRRMIDMLLGDSERAQDAIDRYERETGNRIGMTGEAMAEFASDPTRYQLTPNRAHSLLLSLKMVETLAPDFHRMEWAFVHAPENTVFITTDAPYTIIPPPNAGQGPTRWGYGYIHFGTKKIMPLSASVAVVMGDPGSETIHCDVDENAVLDINLRLAADAYRFVISRDEAPLHTLVEEIRRVEREQGFRWGGSRIVFG